MKIASVFWAEKYIVSDFDAETLDFFSFKIILEFLYNYCAIISLYSDLGWRCVKYYFSLYTQKRFEHDVMS